MPEVTEGDPARENRGRELLTKIHISDSLTAAQRHDVEELVLTHQDAWALDLREVTPNKLDECDFDIDPSVPLQMRPRRVILSPQEQEAAMAYADILHDAGFIRPIAPSQVKCVSDVIMVPKKVEEHRASKEATLDKAERAISRLLEEGDAESQQGDTRDHAERSSGLELPDATGDGGPNSPAPHAVSPFDEIVREQNGAAEMKRKDHLEEKRRTAKGWRMVLNLKPLNRAINAPPYLPGDLHRLVSRLVGKRFISVVDQLAAFWAFGLSERCQPYTAFFITGRGYYVHTRMPQGLGSSPYYQQAGCNKAYCKARERPPAGVPLDRLTGRRNEARYG
ncbi:hypothetical protein FFLO_07215 [Filobasidium floriforme]|uniref:Uncharacterized protein n=1 Tax=Filobasidium floriforme TaxID=5210 RepID=A0A8K0JDX5_9TREE|nr:hypothetical protein FFLO_07215 [Filobasidium floriforme]